jgi:coatomer subunit beta'
MTAKQAQALAKSFEATDLPARCSKFVARKQWVVIGSDDMLIRVFNYNTMDREKMFEAHTDYIRSVAVHPSLPYLLSCSDDMLIKLWDWDKGWSCTQVFEGHVHYVMQVRIPHSSFCRCGAKRSAAHMTGAQRTCCGSDELRD